MLFLTRQKIKAIQSFDSSFSHDFYNYYPADHWNQSHSLIGLEMIVRIKKEVTAICKYFLQHGFIRLRTLQGNITLIFFYPRFFAVSRTLKILIASTNNSLLDNKIISLAVATLSEILLINRAIIFRVCFEFLFVYFVL